jgi:hypothetical protein
MGSKRPLSILSYFYLVQGQGIAVNYQSSPGTREKVRNSRIEVLGVMKKKNIRPATFPLRLPMTMRHQANDLAQREGLSLNHFISLAVAEKIVRMENSNRTDNSIILGSTRAIEWAYPVKQ